MSETTTNAVPTVKPSTIRMRRLRARRRNGVRSIRVRFSEEAMMAMVDAGFLDPINGIEPADIEKGVYLMINAIRRSGMRVVV